MREIDREREREIERERERESERAGERESERETEYKNQAKKITPTIFPFVDSGLISLGFSRESPAPQELCGASSLMFIMGERERERRRERERERRREYLAGSYYYNEMRICITYVFTRQFSRVLIPGISSLGFSRESPAGNMGNLFFS